MTKQQPALAPYDCIMPDNAMRPKISKGDKLTIDPGLPPTLGRVHVFTQTGKAERPFVAELVGFTDTDWTVRQYSPDKPIRLSRSEWPAAHRVRIIMYAD